MATAKQIRAAKKTSENIRSAKPKPMGKVLKEAGYADSVTKKPKLVTKSKGWQELMDEYLPDDKLLEVHEQLLKTRRIDHLTFPIGVRTDAEKPAGQEDAILSDEEIVTMIAEQGCKVRKIVHGDQARHVYFWSPDAAAQKAAVELAYKIKGNITNKFEGKVSGELNVALVEFVGDDGNQQSQDTDS